MSKKIILINKLTDKSTLCSKAEAARMMKVAPKTIGEWYKSASIEKSVNPTKEWGIWKIYFEPEEIKQEKGFRTRSNGFQFL